MKMQPRSFHVQVALSLPYWRSLCDHVPALLGNMLVISNAVKNIIMGRPPNFEKRRLCVIVLRPGQCRRLEGQSMLVRTKSLE